MLIHAVGIDAAFANMGFAHVSILINDNQVRFVECRDLKLVQTVSEDRKVVRKSSTELVRARQLHEAIQTNSEGNSLAFAEVPSGSQSASAARSLGIAVGVLASCPIPLIEVSPMEVKDVLTGGDRKRKVSKAEIIQWCAQRWPAAPWLRMKTGKQAGRLLNDNEHLADALVTVMAGIQTPAFKQLIALHHAVPGSSNIRPSPDQPARRRVSLDPL